MKYLLITIVALLPFLTYSQNYYAVLITGDTPYLEADGPKNWNGGEYSKLGYDEFWNDTYLMWELLYDNGFSNDNIFVLFGNGNDWAVQNPRYRSWDRRGIQYITDYQARISDVENIFTWLANGNPSQGIPQLTENDVLFVWTFDHGGSLGGCISTICLMDGQMVDYDFAALVDQIDCNKRIFWMQQCFSGGFIDDLENNKTSILTACACDESAYRADDTSPDGSDPLENEIYSGVIYNHGEFNYHIMNAVRKMTIVNNPISTDLNNDGEVSFCESKDWEFLKDSQWETPQWSDNGNKGASSFANILMDLAYQNKSSSYDATSHNNNHILERGYFGKLYKVFFSGGEIFYRRSSNNGVSWEITKRISTGNGSNNHPSVVAGVGSTDVLRLVWQRKLDNTHYEIWYSYSNNSGTDWSTPAIVPGCTNVAIQYYQSNPGSGPGATPVVSSFWRGGAEGTPSFLLVYAEQSGLRYRYANDNNLSWTIPASDIVPQSNYSSMTWYPCLANYSSQVNNVNLIYDDRFDHVYSQIYNGDGTWTNRVIADGVGTYNRMCSLALDYTNNMLGVWSGWNSTNSNYVIRFRQGFSNGTWSSWAKEWSTSGTNLFNPVVSYYNKGGYYPYGIDILWYNTLNQIRQKKYYGLGDNWIPTDPNTQLLFSNGLFANITHERQNTTYPKQTHTDQSAQPYSLMDNSTNLPKENLFVNGSNYRAAEITDSLTNTNFRIELQEPVITLMTGDKIILPFKEYNYQDTLALSTENVFNYLQTKLSNIPSTAQSITFKVNIAASQPDTNSRGTLNNNKTTPFKNVVFKLLAKDNSLNTLLNNIGYVTLNNSSGIYQYSKVSTINIQALRNKNIFIIPNISISGSFNQNDLLFSLVNISIEENSIAKDSTEIVKNAVKPTEYILEQNYPNPFNPVTQIKYSIVDNGIATLKIYDVLGREIATLVNEEKTAGNYEVGFDASNLSSGIYLYTLQVGNFIQTRKMVLLK